MFVACLPNYMINHNENENEKKKDHVDTTLINLGLDIGFKYTKSGLEWWCQCVKKHLRKIWRSIYTWKS